MTWTRAKLPILILSLAAFAIAADLRAADPPAQTQPAKRSMQQIVQDIQSAGADLSQLNPSVLLDAQKRQEAAPKVVPALKKLISLAGELSNLNEPGAQQQGRQMRAQLTSFLVLFGDQDATAELEKQAAGKDPTEALNAKEQLLFAHWLMAHNDAPAQEKLVAEASALARNNPNDNQLTQILAGMSQMGSSNPELSQKIEDVVTGMKSPAAEQMKEQIAGARKLRSLENKPLVIAGAKNGGGDFSTADWKGKVILVDFWATWCGPCREELPRVKKAYSTWHDKGLEVLGVSCDNSGDDLNAFLKSNPDMPWPQLFDPKTAGWHPLATGYGITGIPTMFLIDKKGVVRTVEARENFEDLIPKMLDEK
ncbi:MAG TPA: TlpA disulfide reductase family protein [Tepidisphaeraceae bacterium]|nr:TlpA disulfide reductase family protein [Tepidisphaeraceae bacterium]